MEPAGDQSALRASDGRGDMSERAPRHAESDAEVAACFPVIALPRHALTCYDALVGRVERQRGGGYRTFAAWRDETAAIACCRIEENLIHRKLVYVDDLLTVESERRDGVGAQLLDAVGSYGREQGCHRPTLRAAPDYVLAYRFAIARGLVARGPRSGRPIEQ